MINSALVIQGGSLRCLFSAGVVDVLLENNINLPYVIGISSGSLTGVNYVSKQIGRTSNININFVNDKRYLGFSSLLKNRMIFNFDFLFGEIQDKIMPLDCDEFFNSKQRFLCGATNLNTGKIEYFEKGVVDDIFTPVRASSSMPLMSKIVTINGEHYLDGGCSIAIPYQKAIDDGFEKIVVILTREKDYRKEPVSKTMAKLFHNRFRQYPKFVQSLLNVPKMTNDEYEEINQLEKDGKIFVIRPTKKVDVGKLEKDKQKLKDLYNEGRQICENMLPDLKNYLNIN